MKAKNIFLIIGGCSLVASLGLMLAPWDKFLPASAESYKDIFLEGIHIVQLVLLAAIPLALFSAWKWKLNKVETSIEKVRIPWGILLGLTIIALAPRLINVNDSLWWDELTSVLRYIRRGFPVIFTFSGDCNNHIMVSFFAKISFMLFGEGEWQLRLFSVVFSVLVIPAIYLSLKNINSRLALIVSCLAVVHSSLVVNATESRGYAGAVFCTWLSSYLFSELLKRNSWKLVISYVLINVMGFGFLTNFILIPFAHGIIAGLNCLHQQKKEGLKWDRQGIPFTALFSCLWVGLVSLVAFGIPLPQAFDYLHGDIAKLDHYGANLEIYTDTLNYLFGGRQLIASIALSMLSIVGLVDLAKRDAKLMISFVFPAIIILGWSMLPGALFSPRILILLVPVLLLGLGTKIMRLLEHSKPGKGLAFFFLALFVYIQIPVYHDHINIGYPNTRELAEELRGKEVILFDQMADVNLYYFDYAKSFPKEPENSAELFTGDYLIVGTNMERYRYKPAVARGWEHIKTLESWRPRHPCFRVYKRPTTD